MAELNEAVGALGLAAQQTALLRGALTSGFLAHCADEVSVEDLARVTRLSPGRVRDLCAALRAAEVLASDNPGRYRLSDTYAPLLQHGTDVQIANQLAGAAVQAQLLEKLFTTDGPDRYGDLPDPDRAALAAGVTLAPSTALARGLMSQLLEATPQWQELLTGDDVRYLELGCGLSGGLLTMLQLHPRVTAVGVDLAGDLLDRARVQAATLGVADRVRYVHADAAAFSDPEPFDVVFWSQFFFPAASRVKTLSNAYDRLRPGGLLVTPVLLTGPDTPQAALNVALFRSWDIPVLTAEELGTELGTAGFTAPAVHPGPSGTLVVARRP
uniref:SAM-dependent methyltransferase n=1 Tax=Paractinoplanes polyasparticus TaxID=2856853 RepID=UPI001C844D55|nr:class I SAM-dependent methyltransferase [Actinoplanes polyasparticus]